MKKTITVHINGQSFFMDEDAHEKMEKYLNRLKSRFSGTEGADEIIADIENRMAELFTKKINPSVGVISISIVEEAIAIMGEPDQFEGTNEPNSESSTKGTTSHIPWAKPAKRLYRDPENRVLGGVCSGIGAYFGIETTWVRIFAIFLLLVTAFITAAVVYAILWAILPEARTPSQRLEMRGENINIENIEKTVRDEFEEVKNNFSKMGQSESVKSTKRFFERFNQRDQSALLIVAVIVAFILINRTIAHVIHPFYNFTWNTPWIHFNHMPVLSLVIPISILVIIALSIKNSLITKVILWIIAIVISLVMIAAIITNICHWAPSIFPIYL